MFNQLKIHFQALLFTTLHKAGPHTARIVFNLLENDGIEILPQFLNLNPIEHVWDTLNRRITSHITMPFTSESS